MDGFNPYELLGIEEDAAFEEVTAVRDRLLKAAADDPVELERIEAAYDAILRDRLRARIEGKIAVPDRIRYAERSLNDLIGESTTELKPLPAPSWLANLWERPRGGDILITLLVYGGLGLVGYLVPANISLSLSLGLIAGFYLLHRKENRVGRTLMWLAIALVVGIAVGHGLTQVGGVLQVNLLVAILLCLWLVTTFCR
ncbi:MAG: CPP1-like family protein [Pseudanabaenaceae cyanobacterium SKYGB_i_bin29]|nr:CPP1-like family protein [Pseudanabaenaceae cyanobacterium SKYG29]MDW8422200.1 CPP1-like family protein [Pseudanabaenaceae cyanobacterium SKYGB_i_bin29]